MAQRRMFHADVVESDRFLDLPAGVQLLYFHMGMQADDDGFVIGPKQICRKLRRPAKELQQLIDSGFVLDFDGILVIKHFRVANNLKSDRVRPFVYPEIAKQIYIGRTREYFLEPQPESENLYDHRWNFLESRKHPRREEEKREEKKIEENKAEESSREECPESRSDALRFMNGTLGKGVLLLTDGQRDHLLERLGLDAFNYYTDKLSTLLLADKVKSRNHYATIMKWYLEDTEVAE